jgi:hypothetical protein
VRIPPEENPTELAVDAEKTPPMLRVAFLPKIIPLGLIRKRFLPGSALKSPSMKEGEEPRIRARILIELGELVL